MSLFRVSHSRSPILDREGGRVEKDIFSFVFLSLSLSFVYLNFRNSLRNMPC